MTSAIWIAFEDGRTVGSTGSEGGEILLDVEHGLGARATLEDTGPIPGPGPALAAVTCGIYGAMVHTVYFESVAQAQNRWPTLLDELQRLLSTEAAPDQMDDFTRRW